MISVKATNARRLEFQIRESEHIVVATILSNQRERAVFKLACLKLVKAIAGGERLAHRTRTLDKFSAHVPVYRRPILNEQNGP